MRIFQLVALALLVACGGDDDDTSIDAPTNLPACTNAVFDPCTDNAQCTSNNCKLFNGDFQVCTQTCTPGDNTTCPVDKSGANGNCNNMGICKPSAPNACMR
jgi:hypothetical protein